MSLGSAKKKKKFTFTVALHPSDYLRAFRFRDIHHHRSVELFVPLRRRDIFKPGLNRARLPSHSRKPPKLGREKQRHGTTMP